MSDQIFRDSNADRAFKAKRFTGRAVIYGILILWALIALFPIYCLRHFWYIFIEQFSCTKLDSRGRYTFLNTFFSSRLFCILLRKAK